MYRENKISPYQLFTLLLAFLFGSSLVFNPAISAKSDAWLAFIIGLSDGIILIMIYLYIYKLNPSMTLVAILKKVFGRVVGTFFSIIYILYFIHLAAMVLRTFGEYSLTVTYPETPILFVICCLSLSLSLAVRSGIEILGRISEVFAVIAVIVIIYVSVLIITSFEVDNLKPFLSKGLMPVLVSSFGVTTLPFGESITFLMFLPNLNKQKKVFSSYMLSTLFFGVFMLIVTLRNIMVLGGDFATSEIFSSVRILKMLPGVEFVPLLDLNYILVGIIKVGILLYAAATGITEVLNLNDYKPFVFPLTIVIVSLSIWVYNNFLEDIQWAIKIYPIYSSLFQIILPVFILIFSLIIRYKKNSKVPSG